MQMDVLHMSAKWPLCPEPCLSQLLPHATTVTALRKVFSSPCTHEYTNTQIHKYTNIHIQKYISNLMSPLSLASYPSSRYIGVTQLPRVCQRSKWVKMYNKCPQLFHAFQFEPLRSRLPVHLSVFPGKNKRVHGFPSNALQGWKGGKQKIEASSWSSEWLPK